MNACVRSDVIRSAVPAKPVRACLRPIVIGNLAQEFAEKPSHIIHEPGLIEGQRGKIGETGGKDPAVSADENGVPPALSSNSGAPITRPFRYNTAHVEWLSVTVADRLTDVGSRTRILERYRRQRWAGL